jgi:SPX domain protein involved in polyphosphate accumulation
VNAKKMHEIKLAFSEFYLSLILLQNYQTLNFTGFRKILKKHDKVRADISEACSVSLVYLVNYIMSSCIEDKYLAPS